MRQVRALLNPCEHQWSRTGEARLSWQTPQAWPDTVQPGIEGRGPSPSRGEQAV